MKPEILKAPFPWFGGKSRVAPQVWERFGDVDNYVEPFAGSLAVLPESWECVHWKSRGGYGNQRGDQGYENAARERIWFSPHCLRGKQLDLFSGLAGSPASAPAAPSRGEAAESPRPRRAGRQKGGNPAP